MLTPILPTRSAQPLMLVPQRWGIAPTTRFWRDRSLSRRLRWSIHACFIVQAAVLASIVVFGGLGLASWQRLALIPAGALLEWLQYGIAERLLRREVLARRTAAEALAPACERGTALAEPPAGH